MRRTLPAVVLVLVAVVLAGCSGYSGGEARQVAQWASGAQLATNDGYVVADLADISRGISAGDLGATHTACDGLASDAATAYGELPTPLAALTDDLATAYLDDTRAAQDCTSAGSFAAPGFRRYRATVARGIRAFDAAQRILRRLGDG